MLRAISISTMLIFFSGVRADTLPDVFCRPINVADEGYGVKLVRNENGHYSGAFFQYYVAGAFIKYLGAVKIEKLSPSPRCELAVSNTVEAKASFQMQMLPSGEAQIISVDGQPISEFVGAEHCKFTKSALSDINSLCDN